MPKYRLHYFNARARAEIARILFVYAGVEFEDIVYADPVDDAEEWAKVKPTIPLGRVPVLEIDGKPLTQSIAIATYLAREFGLAGKDALEEGAIYEAFFYAQDILESSWKVFHLKFDPIEIPIDDVYELKKKSLIEKDLPMLFSALETLLGDKQYFVGSNVTVGDLNVFLACDGMLVLQEKHPKRVCCFMDKYPKLLAHHNRIAAIPSIASHLAKFQSSRRQKVPGGTDGFVLLYLE